MPMLQRLHWSFATTQHALQKLPAPCLASKVNGIKADTNGKHSGSATSRRGGAGRNGKIGANSEEPAGKRRRKQSPSTESHDDIAQVSDQPCWHSESAEATQQAMVLQCRCNGKQLSATLWLRVVLQLTDAADPERRYHDVLLKLHTGSRRMPKCASHVQTETAWTAAACTACRLSVASQVCLSLVWVAMFTHSVIFGSLQCTRLVC